MARYAAELSGIPIIIITFESVFSVVAVVVARSTTVAQELRVFGRAMFFCSLPRLGVPKKKHTVFRRRRRNLMYFLDKSAAVVLAAAACGRVRLPVYDRRDADSAAVAP